MVLWGSLNSYWQMCAQLTDNQKTSLLTQANAPTSLWTTVQMLLGTHNVKRECQNQARLY